MDPKHLRYNESHEWASLENGVCTIGITKFAADQMEIVFIELPDVGDHVFVGDEFGEIESVKAVSPLYSPVNGEVIATNDKLESDPSPVSKDPYGGGWMIKVKVDEGTTLDKMLTAEQYQKQIAAGGH